MRDGFHPGASTNLTSTSQKEQRAQEESNDCGSKCNEAAVEPHLLGEHSSQDNIDRSQENSQVSKPLV